MKLLAVSMALLVVLQPGNSPAARSHRVALTSGSGRYEMSPDDLTVSPGDTLVFHVESGGPHALGIDPQGLTVPTHEAWNGALPHRVGDLRGPLMRQNDSYQVVIPRSFPKGKYRVFCLPHRAYDEDLTLEVK
ncbi:MAG: plastocyanin/azurin family copper-binding protein [Gemmatimonadota bacterium]